MSVLKRCILMLAVFAAFFSGSAHSLLGSVAKADKHESADKGDKSSKADSGGSCA